MKAAGTPSPLGSSVEPEDQGTGHPGPTRTPASSATPSGRAGHRATHPCPATEKTPLDKHPHRVTTQPFNSDSLHFRDQVASNSGGGAGFSAGRIAAIAVDPNHANVIYAGGADGGVFRSLNDGASWTPIADFLPALSVGSLTVMPDGSLWLGTGEATTAFENYVGSGVYRLASPTTGTFTSADRVGGAELESSSIHEIRLDAPAGYVFAVTSHGIFRRGVGDSQSAAWQKVLAPCAGIGISGVPCGALDFYADIANDLVVQPGSKGQTLVANVAWRSGASYNGFYYSNDAGTTWHLANPTARYWNFFLSCFSFDLSQNTCDGNVTHPDQHALAFSTWSGHTPEVYVGNDAGMYARPTGQTTAGWRNLNASGTLRTLQYYGIAAGSLPGGGTAVWGGMQDNGASLLAPTGSTYTYTYPGTTTPVVEQLNPKGEMSA